MLRRHTGRYLPLCPLGKKYHAYAVENAERIAGVE